jgi:superfamily II DNA/RNA helicase
MMSMILRGLDLPDVEHVIQAEFALNVVQHMHRNGRASRAGKQGRATIIFDNPSSDLVHSVLSNAGPEGGEGGGTIDASFSRRRGFRRNLNRKMKRQEGMMMSQN